MWILLGFLGGLCASVIAQRFTWLKGGLICLIPVAVWFLAFFGVLGPGMTDSNYPQFGTAMLGIMFGVTAPNLLDRRHWLRKRNSTPDP